MVTKKVKEDAPLKETDKSMDMALSFLSKNLDVKVSTFKEPHFKDRPIDLSIINDKEILSILDFIRTKYIVNKIKTQQTTKLIKQIYSHVEDKLTDKTVKFLKSSNQPTRYSSRKDMDIGCLFALNEDDVTYAVRHAITLDPSKQSIIFSELQSFIVHYK